MNAAFVFAVVALLFAASIAQEIDCGKVILKDVKKGDPTTPNPAEFDTTWQVTLVTNGGEPLCGGTLVARDWVLTSATCVND